VGKAKKMDVSKAMMVWDEDLDLFELRAQ